MKINEKMKECVTLSLEKEPCRQKKFLVFTVDQKYDTEFMLEPDDKIINGNIDEYGEWTLNGKIIAQGVFHDKKLSGYNATDFTEFISEHKQIYAVCNIRTSRSIRALLYIGCLCSATVWLNGRCIACGLQDWNDGYVVYIPLEPKDNDVVIRLSVYKDSYYKNRLPLAFSIRAEADPDLSSHPFKDYIQFNTLGKTVIADNGWDCRDALDYNFMLLPKDFFSRDPSIPQTISLRDIAGNVLFSCKVLNQKAYNIDLSKYLKFGPVLTLTLDNSKKEVSILRTLQLDNLDELIEDIKNDCIDMFYQCEQDRLNIESRLKLLENFEEKYTLKKPYENNDICGFMQTYYELKDLLKTYNGCFNDYLMNKRYAGVFYRSAYDDSIELYNIALPPKYGGGKKKKLIVFMGMDRYSWYSNYYHTSYASLDAIVVDVSCRGFTMGSYIGEISFLECIKLICDTYDVDIDRIYMIGYAIGSFAAWFTAQAHPNLFAAIAVLSGAPYYNNICNLKNLNIYNVCGDGDNYLEPGLIRAGTYLQEHTRAHYQQIILPEADDNTVRLFSYNNEIISWLFQHVRNAAPDVMCYRTERGIHNSCYWIKILDVIDKSTYACIESVIKDDTVCIQTENISVLMIRLPHNIKYVLINGMDQTYYLTKKGTRIYRLPFGKETGKLLTTNPYFNLYGNGLLQIYMSKVKILVDFEGCEEDREKNIFEKVARSFQHPVSTGTESNIYINIPIIDNIHQIDLTEIKQNLILVINSRQYDKYKTILENPFISFDDNGFNYMEKNYYGEYCAMFILPQMHQSDRYILCLCTNNPNYFRSFFFARKIQIPTYAQGTTSFYNHCAIFFINNNYKYIKNWGEEMKDLIPKEG